MTALCVSFCFRSLAQSLPTRSKIEVCDYLVDGPVDKDEAAKAIIGKISRLSDKLRNAFPDLPGYKNLLKGGQLEVERLGEPLQPNDHKVDYWSKTNYVLEIIEGAIFGKENPTTMDSDVYLGDLSEDLSEDTLHIHTVLNGNGYGPFGDLHCALALYALAMDLKHRYPMAKDAKEKKTVLSIISQYLGQVPTYLPPPDAGKIDENQKELSKAVDQELKWCKEEASKP